MIFLSYRSLWQGFADFFGECSLICPFLLSHQKKEMFHLYIQVFPKFSMNFVNLIVRSPSIEHPNKRTVRKLRYYKTIH